MSPKKSQNIQKRHSVIELCRMKLRVVTLDVLLEPKYGAIVYHWSVIIPRWDVFTGHLYEKAPW